ncbi:hypothetical protein [Sporosalibacterium faouarense]|uniref:hypothetical protein n=1 Tax=Sporosalibacterium faouarense TaxID=516123 RepID=UPI00141D1ABA|nr:hypothetical protein [Sporosalibacterium faouarense]MTI47033.1 hypothetical protein [Bacillota bacterium]
MRKLEVKQLGPGSVFKTVIYLMCIPMALFVLVGFIAMLIGIFTGEKFAAVFGGVYLFMPIVMILIYGGFAALVALIYNLFAQKFGGLEIHVEDEIPAYSAINEQAQDNESTEY